MKLKVGDLVRRKGQPSILGTVTTVYTTTRGADTCEVVVVSDKLFPQRVGLKKYLNQDYWNKVKVSNYLEGGDRSS